MKKLMFTLTVAVFFTLTLEAASPVIGIYYKPTRNVIKEGLT